MLHKLEQQQGGQWGWLGVNKGRVSDNEVHGNGDRQTLWDLMAHDKNFTWRKPGNQ